MGAVPAPLQNRRLLTLDMASMVAGSKYRGEFEERIKRVIKEAEESQEVLLFIDELHTIIGAGGAEGAMDASNILKPSLAAARSSSSALPRSRNIGNTSRKTLHWSGVSSL